MESEQNWLLHLTVNQAPSAYGVRVPGSPPVLDALVQLVRILACHASGQGFEPPTHRQVRSEIAQSVERRTVNPQVPGSSPGSGAMFCPLS